MAATIIVVCRAGKGADVHDVEGPVGDERLIAAMAGEIRCCLAQLKTTSPRAATTTTDTVS